MTDETQRDKLFHKVRSLLKKAESTPFEDEAAAFFAKAQELVVKYAIDEEQLWADDPSKREEIITAQIEIKDRGAGANHLRHILHMAAANNRCRMWYSEGMNTSTIAGFSSDVIFTEMLFVSIRKHMNFEYAKAVAYGRTSHHKTFRNEFLAGYSDRIGERFNEYMMQQREYLSTHQTNTGKSTELVIRDRKQKVDDWVNSRVRLTRGRSQYNATIKDAAARGKGRVAAETADLSGGRGGAVRTGRKELGQ